MFNQLNKMPTPFSRLAFCLIRFVFSGKEKIFIFVQTATHLTDLTSVVQEDPELLTSQVPITNTVRLISIAAQPFFTIFFVLGVVSFVPDHLRIALKGQNMGGDPV